MTKNIKTILVFGAALLAMASCSAPRVPADYMNSPRLPQVYPDYINVTVPVNIAPLSMELRQPADEVITRYAFGSDEIICEGKAQPGIDAWKALAAKASGRAISVEVYARNADRWTRFKPFNIFVSPDSIDPYISYRLISPSFVTYEELTINQRSLEDYWEAPIYDNMLLSTENSGQCINCHNYQAYDPGRMQFHARQNHGGTFIAYDGQTRKVNMSNDSLISAGVYPAWHPTQKLIAYSTNKTMQSFHTRDINKIEVLDSRSDLILYDLDRNEVSNIENQPDEFEIYPFWAPDGKSLYYCSAHFEYLNDTVSEGEAIQRAKEIKYSIYRKSFDPGTRLFGPREMVFDAAGMDKSATLPRISPDGRWLLFTLGGWGCFHIWHRDADLWLMDLTTMQARPLAECNSNNVESYHSFSSNGRWIIFSSRRDDGVFTRPFIAHIDKNGRGAKPFELPTEDPDYHRQLMKSYNIPEFMKGRVRLTPQQIADVLKNDNVTPVTFKQK